MVSSFFEIGKGFGFGFMGGIFIGFNFFLWCRGVGSWTFWGSGAAVGSAALPECCNDAFKLLATPSTTPEFF